MLYNGVGWVDKPNVSDGLWACWIFNPTYPLCHFFMHSTIFYSDIQAETFTKPDICHTRVGGCLAQSSALLVSHFSENDKITIKSNI